MSIEDRLDEIKDEIRELEKAEEACEYALYYIYETEGHLTNGIIMSHHAGMEMEDVLGEIQDRKQYLEDKIEAI
jgi:hypothetical protein